MKKLLKWLGILVVIVIAVGVLAFFTMKSKGLDKLSEKHTVAVESPPMLTDSAALVRGAHLADVLCTECHGPNLGGMAMIDDESFGKLNAPNLTRGEGGAASHFTIEDWDRAIRHGIAIDGTSLFIMPSISFHSLTDYDFGAIVGHINSIEPVDDVIRHKEFVPFIQFLMGVGAFDGEIQALAVNHDAPRPQTVDATNTLENGDYLHRIGGCNHCHGEKMAGGPPRGPDSPPAPNITMGGEMGEWTEAQFISTIRTGVNPAGRELDPIEMPWRAFGKFTDKELSDIYAYIKAQPALPDAEY